MEILWNIYGKQDLILDTFTVSNDWILKVLVKELKIEKFHYITGRWIDLKRYNLNYNDIKNTIDEIFKQWDWTNLWPFIEKFFFNKYRQNFSELDCIDEKQLFEKNEKFDKAEDKVFYIKTITDLEKITYSSLSKCINKTIIIWMKFSDVQSKFISLFIKDKFIYAYELNKKKCFHFSDLQDTINFLKKQINRIWIKDWFELKLTYLPFWNFEIIKEIWTTEKLKIQNDSVSKKSFLYNDKNTDIDSFFNIEDYLNTNSPFYLEHKRVKDMKEKIEKEENEKKETERKILNQKLNLIEKEERDKRNKEKEKNRREKVKKVEIETDKILNLRNFIIKRYNKDNNIFNNDDIKNILKMLYKEILEEYSFDENFFNYHLFIFLELLWIVKNKEIQFTKKEIQTFYNNYLEKNDIKYLWYEILNNVQYKFNYWQIKTNLFDKMTRIQILANRRIKTDIINFGITSKLSAIIIENKEKIKQDIKKQGYSEFRVDEQVRFEDFYLLFWWVSENKSFNYDLRDLKIYLDSFDLENYSENNYKFFRMINLYSFFVDESWNFKYEFIRESKNHFIIKERK